MSTDDKKLAAENTRYHVCKNVEQLGVHLRDTAALLDSFAQQLASLPIQTIDQNGHSLTLPGLPNYGSSSARNALMSPTDATGEAGTKRKRQRKDPKDKKPKDPNAPKRPPSAYLLYQNDVRKTMQAKFPQMSYREVLVEIARSWNEMSESDKKMYNDATTQAKGKYAEAKAAYEHPNGAAVPVPATAVAKPKPASAAKAVATKGAPATASSEEASEEEEEEESSDASSSDEPEPPKKKVAAEPARAPRKSVAVKDDKKKRKD